MIESVVMYRARCDRCEWVKRTVDEAGAAESLRLHTEKAHARCRNVLCESPAEMRSGFCQSCDSDAMEAG